MSLVVETFNFQMYCTQKHYHFILKIVRSFAQAPHNFSAKNITAIDFVSTVRPKESLTSDFVKLTML